MAVMLLSCPDQPGIVAKVATFIHDRGGNIIHADQHADRTHGRFLQRVEFDLPSWVETSAFTADFAPLAANLSMNWNVVTGEVRQRLAILVSQQGHCLHDLLARSAMGDLPADIAAVISNHDTHADAAARFNIPFIHLPVDPNRRSEQHGKLLSTLDQIEPDLIVMARYMQILPSEICERFRHRIINIHHSFLPAFLGAKPYHQAYDRGVKLIGATAHYATSDLDQGPIICQDVTAVSHRDDVDRLVQRGRDLEMIVLARSVQLHLEHRVLAYANRTVVFD